MSWKDNEQYAFEEVKKLFPGDIVKLEGGLNSDRSDINVGNRFMIEVKSLVAQCGQDMSSEECDDPVQWVIDHYESFNVAYFAFVDERKKFFKLIPLNRIGEFSQITYCFRPKYSGSARLPKKDMALVQSMLPFGDIAWENNKAYWNVPALTIDPFYLYNGEDRYFVSLRKEIRKCSKTRNITRIFSIKYKG